MSPSEVDWGPALVVAGVGLALGAFFAWRVLARRGAAPAAVDPVPLPLRDLFGKRDALIAQLRELEDTASKRTPEQLAQERYALELEAARVLQQIDAEQPALPAAKLSRKAARALRKAHASEATAGAAVETPDAEAPAPTSVPAPASGLRGFLWGAGSMAGLALLLFFVTQSAKERSEGGSLTGNLPGEQPAAAGSDAELERARAEVARKPDDVDARLGLARLLLIRQDMMGVFNETQTVLQKSPGNPRALSYQSLVRLAMGQGPRAEAMLKEALAKDPDLLEGYIHLMLVYVRTTRNTDAEATLKLASARFPERAESLERLLGEMRASETADPKETADTGEDPHKGVADPGGGAADASRLAAGSEQAPAGSAKTVAGVIELDPSVTSVPARGAIVFVTLREAGFGAGPPLAAKRIASASFPLRFEIGAADSMSGMPIPDDVLVEARVDSDGDPMTRAPSDPYGREDHVKIGAKDVRLLLKPKS
jgi:tetratricopeptide (TPR) repeat protein